MMYRIVTYDRTTEHMKGSLIVPPSVSPTVKKIAGFKPEDDGLGEYALDSDQARRIAKILGFVPECERFHYCVEPYEPAEDTGFREEAPPVG